MRKQSLSTPFSSPVFASIIAICCTLLWGSAYPAIKLGYELFSIGPDATAEKLLFAGIRFFFAGILVLLFTYFPNKGKKLKERLVTRKNIGKVLCLGLLQTTVQYFFFYVGLSYTTGSKGAIINATSVFFSAILSHIWYADDHLSIRKSIGIAIGFFGVVVVNFSQSLRFVGTFRGEGFLIIAALVISISSLYSKKLTKHVDPLPLTGFQLTFGGSVLCAIGFLFGSSLPTGDIGAYLLLAYMSLLSAVAFVLWANLLKYNRISRVTIFYFLIPIFGTILSSLILQESVFELQYLIALCAVASGIWLVTYTA